MCYVETIYFDAPFELLDGDGREWWVLVLDDVGRVFERQH